jgi:hypothetical protein
MEACHIALEGLGPNESKLNDKPPERDNAGGYTYVDLHF